VSAFVFAGPTLPPEAAPPLPGAVFLPPAAQGDVYRAALRRPRAIGIIDGFFEARPAVWHKEILWALDRGVHVYGSASMGALRAAELESFGMRGVGRIFEAYRDGELEDDDEVALAHAPAEQSFRPLSEPMVNVRETFAAAEAAGVLGTEARATLVRVAKALFYPERSYPTILERAGEEGVAAAEIDALRSWLPGGRVDQKRADALAMLERMGADLDSDWKPAAVDFVFQYTHTWDVARRAAGDIPLPEHPAADGLAGEHLVEELQLRGPETYGGARRGSLARLLAIDEARRAGVRPTRETIQTEADAFRIERELLSVSELDAWLARNDLDRDRLFDLIEEELLAHRGESGRASEIAVHLPSYLRVSGEYAELRERARRKWRALAERALDNASLADAGIDAEALYAWYFNERLGRTVPDDVGVYAEALGFGSEESFRHAVLREYCFVERLDGEGVG
jgi:hypothetical protein